MAATDAWLPGADGEAELDMFLDDGFGEFESDGFELMQPATAPSAPWDAIIGECAFDTDQLDLSDTLQGDASCNASSSALDDAVLAGAKQEPCTAYPADAAAPLSRATSLPLSIDDDDLAPATFPGPSLDAAVGSWLDTTDLVHAASASRCDGLPSAFDTGDAFDAAELLLSARGSDESQLRSASSRAESDTHLDLFGSESAASHRPADGGPQRADAVATVPVPAAPFVQQPAHVVRMMPVWMTPSPQWPQGRMVMMPVHFMAADAAHAGNGGMAVTASAGKLAGSPDASPEAQTTAFNVDNGSDAGLGAQTRKRRAAAARNSSGSDVLPTKKLRSAPTATNQAPGMVAPPASMPPRMTAMPMHVPVNHSMAYLMPTMMPVRRKTGAGGTLPPFASQPPVQPPK